MFVLFLGHLQQNIHEFTMWVSSLFCFNDFHRRVGCFASVLLVFSALLFIFIFFFFF